MQDDGFFIEVRSLRVDFDRREGSVPAVNDIDFDLDRGLITAMIGESGSGKSATCLAMAGLIDNAQVSGQMRLADIALPLGSQSSRLTRLRGRRIGMIFQDPVGSLNPVRTIGSQLCETLRTLTDVRGSRDVEARSIELLRTVRLPDPRTVLRSYPHQLSGGMNQRVMIALALAGRPELLIADEPTTALDVTVQREILELISHLRDDTGLTILLVTHDIDVAKDYADKLLVMRHGELVEKGAVSSVLQAPQHPYTRQLLDAALSLGATLGSRMSGERARA